MTKAAITIEDQTGSRTEIQKYADVEAMRKHEIYIKSMVRNANPGATVIFSQI